MSQATATNGTVGATRSTPRLFLGRVVATPGVTQLVQEGRFNPLEYLTRHVCGDWEVVYPEDRQLNERSVNDGGRLMSSYKTEEGVTVWIITESDRSHTTLLLPSEY